MSLVRSASGASSGLTTIDHHFFTLLSLSVTCSVELERLHNLAASRTKAFKNDPRGAAHMVVALGAIFHVAVLVFKSVVLHLLYTQVPGCSTDQEAGCPPMSQRETDPRNGGHRLQERLLTQVHPHLLFDPDFDDHVFGGWSIGDYIAEVVRRASNWFQGADSALRSSLFLLLVSPTSSRIQRVPDE